MANQRDKRYIENMYDFKNKVRCINDFTDNTLNRTLTMFTYENLPDTIPERELELLLQTHGKCIIAKDNDGNLVALWGNYAPPLNVYYQSTKILVNNPWANISKEFTINDDCILVRNDPLDKGLLDIIWKYGALDGEANITFKNALVAYRAMFNIIASNDNEMKSAENYIKHLENGDIAAMMNSFNKFNSNGTSEQGIQIQPGANASSSVITQIIEGKQAIKAGMWNELGLTCNGNFKRERLVSAEVNADQTIKTLVDAMLEQRQIAMDKVNEMFGTNIKVAFNSAWCEDEMVDEDTTEMTEEPVEDIEEVSETQEEVADEATETIEVDTIVIEAEEVIVQEDSEPEEKDEDNANG